MNDLMKQFEEFLPEWAHKKHYPLPKVNKRDKHWQEAWLDFMRDVLVPKWDENKAYFNNIKMLTKTEERKLKNKTPEPEVEKESSWQRMQQFLNKS